MWPGLGPMQSSLTLSAPCRAIPPPSSRRGLPPIRTPTPQLQNLVIWDPLDAEGLDVVRALLASSGEAPLEDESPALPRVALDSLMRLQLRHRTARRKCPALPRPLVSFNMPTINVSCVSICLGPPPLKPSVIVWGTRLCHVLVLSCPLRPCMKTPSWNLHPLNCLTSTAQTCMAACLPMLTTPPAATHLLPTPPQLRPDS